MDSIGIKDIRRPRVGDGIIESPYMNSTTNVREWSSKTDSGERMPVDDNGNLHQVWPLDKETVGLDEDIRILLKCYGNSKRNSAYIATIASHSSIEGVEAYAHRVRGDSFMAVARELKKFAPTNTSPYVAEMKDEWLRILDLGIPIPSHVVLAYGHFLDSVFGEKWYLRVPESTILPMLSSAKGDTPSFIDLEELSGILHSLDNEDEKWSVLANFIANKDIASAHYIGRILSSGDETLAKRILNDPNLTGKATSFARKTLGISSIPDSAFIQSMMTDLSDMYLEATESSKDDSDVFRERILVRLRAKQRLWAARTTNAFAESCLRNDLTENLSEMEVPNLFVFEGMWEAFDIIDSMTDANVRKAILSYLGGVMPKWYSHYDSFFYGGHGKESQWTQGFRGNYPLEQFSTTLHALINGREEGISPDSLGEALAEVLRRDRHAVPPDADILWGRPDVLFEAWAHRDLIELPLEFVLENIKVGIIPEMNLRD